MDVVQFLCSVGSNPDFQDKVKYFLLFLQKHSFSGSGQDSKPFLAVPNMFEFPFSILRKGTDSSAGSVVTGQGEMVSN